MMAKFWRSCSFFSPPEFQQGCPDISGTLTFPMCCFGAYILWRYNDAHQPKCHPWRVCPQQQRATQICYLDLNGKDMERSLYRPLNLELTCFQTPYQAGLICASPLWPVFHARWISFKWPTASAMGTLFVLRPIASMLRLIILQEESFIYIYRL